METLIENGRGKTICVFQSMPIHKLIVFLNGIEPTQIKLDVVERHVREITDGSRKYVSRKTIFNLSMADPSKLVLHPQFKPHLHHRLHIRQREKKSVVSECANELEEVVERSFDRGLTRQFIDEAVSLASVLMELSTKDREFAVRSAVSEMRKIRLAWKRDENASPSPETSMINAFLALKNFIGKRWHFTKNIHLLQVGTGASAGGDLPYINVIENTIRFKNKKGIYEIVVFTDGAGTDALAHINALFAITHSNRFFIYLSGARKGKPYTSYNTLSKWITRQRVAKKKNIK